MVNQDQVALQMETFYLEELCTKADLVYRFLICLRANKTIASKGVHEIFKVINQELSQWLSKDTDTIKIDLLKRAFVYAQSQSSKEPVGTGKLGQFFSTLTDSARATLVLVDVMGLDRNQLESILKPTHPAPWDSLAEARSALVKVDGRPLNITNNELLLNLGTYLDDALSPSEKQSFEGLLQNSQAKDLAERFGRMRGFLQVSLQSFIVGETELHDLRVLFKSDAAREVEEKTGMERIEKVERSSRVKLWFSLGTISILIGVGVYFALKPVPKAPFKPLHTLVFEAQALEEDGEDRLTFPIESFRQAMEYLQSDPQLGFDLPNLEIPLKPWQTSGATIIDYETAKIAAVQLKKDQGPSVVLFFYKGTMGEITPSNPANLMGLVYQTYATDTENIVAWQLREDIMGMAIGKGAAIELAELARTVSGIR